MRSASLRRMPNGLRSQFVLESQRRAVAQMMDMVAERIEGARKAASGMMN